MLGLGVVLPLAAAVAASLPGVPTGSGATRMTVRPASIYLGDISGSTLSGDRADSPIQWQTWAGAGAVGHGIEKVNLCRPDCAAGRFGDYPVTITFSQPGQVEGRHLFRSFALRYTSPRRPPGTELTRWPPSTYRPAAVVGLSSGGLLAQRSRPAK